MSNVAIYKDILCLEIRSPDGPKWWPQGGSLAYTPIKVAEVAQIVLGTLAGRGRVLTLPLELQGRTQLVVVNLPRSDLWALQQRGLLPPDFTPNGPLPSYQPWPSYALWNPSLV